MMRTVIFFFTHATLTRVWARAAEMLAGEGVRLKVLSQMHAIDWEAFLAEDMAEADAVYLDVTRHFSIFPRLLEAAQNIRYVLPAGMETEAAWAGTVDREAQLCIAAYFKAGTAEDLANAARYLLHRAGVRDPAPAGPSEPVLSGIYHPASPELWRDTATALAWLDGRMAAAAGQALPVVALLFDRHAWLGGETELVDACVRHLEASGLAVLPMFCDWDGAAPLGAPDNPLRRFLNGCGARLAAIWNAGIVYRREAQVPGGPFAAHDVPVLQLVRHWSGSAAEWRNDAQGLSPMMLSFSLSRPEMLGCIDPTLIACSPRADVGTERERRVIELLDDQLARLVARTRAWIALRRKPNADKRIAIMLHNPPCKSIEATIGNAAALDALQSVVDLLKRLRNEGYTVHDIPADGRALLDLILARKAISEFRWTSVDEIVAKGGVLVEIDEATFRADFDRQPEAVRRAVDEAWGVFPGKSMVHHPDGPDPTLLVTGLSFGQVFVMTDPKRGCWGPRCDGEVCRILHDPAIAPSHQWLATFWWLQHQVDALVMMGTEGPLEFLPGKRTGLSESCFPNISLGDLPVIYPYLMSVTGEGMIAKRRGRAVIIDHLGAPVARADALGNRWDALEELLRQYRSSTPGARREALRESLRGELAGMGQAVEDDEALALAIELLPRRLDALRRRMLSVGLHVLGRAPDETDVPRYVEEARRGGLDETDETGMRAALAACDDEIDAVLRALDGRFIAPGPSGHLSRGKIDVLPTGRNFYGVDIACVPTPAAQTVGARMGEKLLNAYLADEGRFPETIAVTLWSTDAFQSDGELTAQILWLLGCAPERQANGKVTGITVQPLEALTMTAADGRTLIRPRIDVVVQMSSVVRDLLPNVYVLFDRAVQAVAELDEPDARNFVRAHVQARFAELRATLADQDEVALKRLASYRCFSSGDGAYSNGVGLALDASAWEDDGDLAEALINTAGVAYGADGRPAALPAVQQMAQYAHLLRRTDLSYQRASSPETDLLSSSCHLAVQGGNAAARRGLGGGAMRLYWGDTQTTREGEVRALAEELSQSLATTVLNPEWLATVQAQGYTGASGISNRVNVLFGWSATTHAITKPQFDAVHDRLVADPVMREWLRETSPHAFEEIVRRLLEAHARGLWAADAQRLDALHAAMLDVEGDLEEAMGDKHVGEHQGSAVDIRTRGDVKEWAYAFSVQSVK